MNIQQIRAKKEEAKRLREESHQLVSSANNAIRLLLIEKAERIKAIRKEYEGIR